MANRYFSTNGLKKFLLAVGVALVLAGCNPWEDSKSYTSQIGGSVGDGPVVGATVTIYSVSGQVLGTLQSDSNAFYRSTVKAKGNVRKIINISPKRRKFK